MNKNITITQHGIEELSKMENLWKLLNQHHGERSPDFAAYYSTLTFDRRKQGILKNAEGGSFQLLLVADNDTNNAVGYCACTVSKEAVGEIESLFIYQEYRSCGIGSTLLEQAIQWMRDTGAEKIAVTVAVGNEEALPLYRKYGLAPKYIHLEMLPEPSAEN